jgi:hypothetical protein
MENISFTGKIFQWKKIHPKVNNFIKIVYSVSKEVKENKEDIEKPDFPISYNKVVERESGSYR